MPALGQGGSTMAGKKINNPHDKFFRATMAHHRVAVDFFNHHLPKNILQVLNVDSLKLTQQSYIDNSLQESISDLVFSCELAGRQVIVIVLSFAVSLLLLKVWGLVS